MHHGEDDATSHSACTAGPIADYIASMVEELAHLAKRNGLDPLAFLLDMARQEADEVSRNTGC